MGMDVLRDVVERIEDFETGASIFVPSEVDDASLDTPVIVPTEPPASADAISGYRYFLDTATLANILSDLRNVIQSPSTAQTLYVLNYYAEHDAYPDIEYVRRL